jgi:hypothetical protein
MYFSLFNILLRSNNLLLKKGAVLEARNSARIEYLSYIVNITVCVNSQRAQFSTTH